MANMTNSGEQENRQRGGLWLMRLIDAVQPDPAGVRSFVERMRSRNPEATRRELAEAIADKLAWRYARQGAALALPGMMPGLGTAAAAAVEAGVIGTDLSILMRNFSWLCMATAEVYGLDLESEDRRTDVLIVTGLWTRSLRPAERPELLIEAVESVEEQFTPRDDNVQEVLGDLEPADDATVEKNREEAAGWAARETAKGVAKDAALRVAGKVVILDFHHIAGGAIRSITRRVAARLAGGYGSRRGAVSMGKLVPFGVGATLAGGFNLATMKGVKRAALLYYDEVLPQALPLELSSGRSAIKAGSRQVRREVMNRALRREK